MPVQSKDQGQWMHASLGKGLDNKSFEFRTVAAGQSIDNNQDMGCMPVQSKESGQWIHVRPGKGSVNRILLRF